jgi:thiosulfate/3-mercaptopyruvate sulfurtransferase
VSNPIRIALHALAVATAVAAPLVAQTTPRESMLVTPQWLARHLHDPNLVLVHVSDRADYDRAHIPGARHLDYREVATMQDPATRLTLQVPADDTLRNRLERIGISNDSRIVVYFAGGSVSPTTRVLFTLLYAGVGSEVSLLDGGIGGWTRAGNTTTADASPATRSGRLTPLTSRPLVVSAEYVRDNIGKPGISVVDSRALAFYDGISEGGPTDARKKGHIPGALNVPFTEVTTSNLELKSADELTVLFRKAGVKPGDTIVTYCHIGQQATAVLFAARTLGYNVLLFDGSFEDWARRGWPVALPTGK